MKSKKIQIGVAVLITLLVFTSSAIAQNPKNWSPQEKLEVVIEGIKNPNQIETICKKYNISESTFEAWKEKLLHSAEMIYDQSRQTDIAEEELSKAPAIVLGDDEIISDLTEEEDRWRFHGALKFWYSEYTKARIFESVRGDKEFSGWAPLGGVAMAFSKGKHAISFSLLTTMDDYSAETYYTSRGTDLRDESEIQTFYSDIRLHRRVAENINVSIGYKYMRHDWEGRSYDLSAGGSTPYDIEISAHGPGLGVNASLPIAESKFSITGIFFLAPYAWVTLKHSEGDSETKEAWLFNPEIGLRYSLFANTNLTLGYRWEANGTYSDGPADIIHGPTFDIATSF